MVAKDCAYDLRKAYYFVLSGMTYNGKTIGVYDSIAPSNAEYPLVILGDQSSRTVRTKDALMRDASIEIVVVAKYTSETGGKKEVNDIVNLISERVILSNTETAIQDELQNWQVINCEFQTNSLILQLPTGWQVEETIIFTQLLNQLN